MGQHWKQTCTMVTYRYTRVINENKSKHDLIPIDGSQGQASSAKAILSPKQIERVLQKYLQH